MNPLVYPAVAAAGYLSGSVSYATIIGRRVSGRDIREMGSRNPGTLNVGASLGKRWGALVAILDALKSFLPMLVASIIFAGEDPRLVFLCVVAAGAAAIVGHWKPVFHGFRGGRCVGTATGFFLFLIPLEFLISFVLGGAFVLLVLRRLVRKWMQWVPLSFILLVPLLTVLLNALVEVRIVAQVSLGGHPWYWMAGIGVVCILMLAINLPYLRRRMHELVPERDAGSGTTHGK